MGLKRVTVVYDTHNRAYTESAYLAFKEEFERGGGTIVKAYVYESGPDTVFINLARRITDQPAGGLFILANAIDTAMLKETIVGTGTFEGLQGSIEFDQFGDVQRRHFLMTIRDGEFETID